MSYKKRLDEERMKSQRLLGELSNGLRSKIDDYFCALRGEATYASKYSGKTVRATAYRKRLELARDKLERIEAEVVLSQRYNKIDDRTAEEVFTYLNSLFSIAIGNNRYVIQTAQREIYPAQATERELSAMREKISIVSSRIMNADTNYDQFEASSRISRDKPFNQQVSEVYSFFNLSGLKYNIVEDPDFASSVPYSPREMLRTGRNWLNRKVESLVDLIQAVPRIARASLASCSLLFCTNLGKDLPSAQQPVLWRYTQQNNKYHQDHVYP